MELVKQLLVELIQVKLGKIYNQVNARTAEKLEEFIEEAFNKHPDSSQDAIDYLYDELLENFLSTDNKSLSVIY